MQRYEQETAHDYRLNHRLYAVCKADVALRCSTACRLEEGELCNGKVLACLSDAKETLRTPACVNEVSYLERMMAGDWRNDM